jgi:hypothetical protein
MGGARGYFKPPEIASLTTESKIAASRKKWERISCGSLNLIRSLHVHDHILGLILK